MTMTDLIPPLSSSDPRLFRMGDALAFVTYPTAGAVFTEEGAVLIDGPMAPATAIQWREFVSERSEIRYHIICEHHEDHTACSSMLEARLLITSELTAHELGATSARSNADMRRTLRGWGRNHQFRDDLVRDYRFRRPDMTYSKRLNFVLGGKRFVVFEAPGHTAGSSIVHAVDDRVAFVADNVFPGTCAPPAQSANPWAWLQTLGVLEALDVDWYVPGHGEPMARDGIHDQRIGLLHLIDTVRRLRREGWSRERIIQEANCFDRTQRPRQAGQEDTPPGLPVIAKLIEHNSVGRVYDYLDAHPSGALHPLLDDYVDYDAELQKC